jgi:hypothetical protein
MAGEMLSAGLQYGGGGTAAQQVSWGCLQVWKLVWEAFMDPGYRHAKCCSDPIRT